MGLTGSKLEKALGAAVPDSERYYGFENFGNTCYCNSVLQALYFCMPFRERLAEYYAKAPKPASEDEDNLLLCLGELFASISSQRRKTGALAPRKFVTKLRKENELFRGFQHQDAHEFLNYLINEIGDTLQKELKELKEKKEKEQHQDKKENGANGTADGDEEEEDGSSEGSEGGGAEKGKKKKKGKQEAPPHSANSSQPEKSFMHDIFEGTLTNETKCLSCETITSKDESFLDLSIGIHAWCCALRKCFDVHSIETLSRGDKFYCDKCCSLQEAQKRMKIKKLPQILVIHLKRFKFIEQLQQYKKLNHRVVFSHELIIQNTSQDAVDAEKRYELFAVVIHVGSGTNHGHYVCMVKSHSTWLLFDDDNIGLMKEFDIASCFGATSDMVTTTDCGYLLFYQCVGDPLGTTNNHTNHTNHTT